jgi:hypothetical protein
MIRYNQYNLLLFDYAPPPLKLLLLKWSVFSQAAFLLLLNIRIVALVHPRARREGTLSFFSWNPGSAG